MTRIRILATSDMHSFIYPYEYSDNKVKNMGMAKLSYLINNLRDENTLVIDNGDNLEGSALSYFHHVFNKGVHPASLALKKMGYTHLNLGNHDFNYGKDITLNHLKDTDIRCITTNISPWNFKYDIVDIGGKKIAIIGVITNYVPVWEPESNIEGLEFLDAFTTLKKNVDEVSDKVDYVVGVYHGGFERDLVSGEATELLTGENQAYKMVMEIEGLDVLITGHQHRSLACKVNNTFVSQTANSGLELACIDIYDDRIEGCLIKPDQGIDESILRLIQKEEDACQKWLDENLGISKVDLEVKDDFFDRLNKHQIITFLNKVCFDLFDVDLVSNALFNGAKGFKKEISMRDIVSTYVYPNTLVVKEIDGKTLKEYLEKCAEFFDIENDKIIISNKYIYPKLQYYNYDMVDGIDYTIKVSNKIGSRIIDLSYKGKPVLELDFFKLMVNNYRASGGGDFFMIRDSKTIKEISSSMVELIANYILKYKVIDFEPIYNIKVIK